jgi:hypothetical protein
MISEIGSDLEAGIRQYLWIRNAEEAPIVLCVEPWGNELPISNGHDYLVVFEGPKGEYPAVEWSKERVTVYGWPGSVAWVFLNRQIVLSCATRVPKIPVLPSSKE